MSLLSVIIFIIAGAILGVLTDWLLKSGLPKEPTRNQRIAGFVASFILVFVVAQLTGESNRLNLDISINLVSLVTTLLTALGLFIFMQELLTAQRARARKTGIPSFREKMEKLSADLIRASAEVQRTLEEMRAVSRAREDALKSLESKLDELSKSEKEMQTRVETLKNVPLPAVEYFLNATEKREKRSAARDYLLFGLGVVASTIVTIVLKLVLHI